MRWVVVIGWVVAGCISPVMTFGEGKTAKQAQRDTMSDFTPARLVVGETWSGEVATRKVRVWADGQYRTQNIKWQQTFEGTIDLANIVLTPLFGLRLVAEYKVWDRHVPGSALSDDLAALAARDPGTDVFAVIGLTSALPLVSATFDDLGFASVGGRHLIVRGYADLEERKLYEDAFRDLMPEERELALEQRRHHKTAVVLLHELGHNLGVDHESGSDETWIMNASYSHRATVFSPRVRAIMLREIDARVGRGGATPKPPDVPSAPARTEPTGPLVFHVTADGDILRDDKKLDGTDIDNLLNDFFVKNRDTEVIIKKARKGPASTVERLVTKATAVGLKRVSISLY